MADELNDCQGESAWRQRGGKDGDRNYQYFREMFPEMDDQIIDQFKLGFGATIIYEDMSQEELGSLIYNAIAIGFVSGKQQSDAASAVWNEAVEACIEQMRKLAARADEIDDTEGAFMLRSVELNLASLKRSDKESGNG